MFENNNKGWYGSYSVIGRNLVQRFALILKKDEIISGNPKKNFYGDYFDTDDTKTIEEDNKNKNKVDIFSTEYDKLKEEKLRIKNEENLIKNANLCSPICEAEKERYKFHQNHHKEFQRNIRLRNKGINVSYNPKMEFIWKKIITGPKWQFLKGRKLININTSLSKKNNDKNKAKFRNRRQSNYFLTEYNFKSIPMHKLTKRGNLPISYDFRIRTDVPYVQKNIFVEEKKEKESKNKNNTRNKNIVHKIFSKTLDKLEAINSGKKKNNQMYLKTYNNNFRKSQKFVESENKNNINHKKTLSKTSSKKGHHISTKNFFQPPLDKDTFNRTINFSKILPRNSNVFVQKKLEDSIPSFSSPNFKLTEPRSISMVSYSKSIRDQIIPKKFIGIDPQLFLEPNKYIDLVNNHKKVSVPNFDIMSGRNQNKGPLPAYMINVCDRRAIETMTDKSLKMNNYANSSYHTGNYSMFKPKKSFNKMINYIIMKNDNDKIEEELKNINEEVFGNKKLKKLIQTYAKDDKDYLNNKIKFDVISLKSYQKERKKNKKLNYPLNYQF